MLIAVWPLLIAIIGLLCWLLTTSKLSEIGKIMFVIGVFWLVYTLTGKSVRIG